MCPVIMNIVTYNLDLLPVKAPIWPHHWPMMLSRIVQNEAHQFTPVYWTQREQCYTWSLLSGNGEVGSFYVCIQGKWGSILSEPENVCKGTRQRGLTSTFLFNLFFNQYLINELFHCTGGININMYLLIYVATLTIQCWPVWHFLVCNI